MCKYVLFTLGYPQGGGYSVYFFCQGVLSFMVSFLLLFLEPGVSKDRKKDIFIEPVVNRSVLLE